MMGSDMTRTNARQSPAQRLWRHAGMAGILGIAVLIGGSVGGSGNLGSFGSFGTAARAQDANDDMPDTKFFRGLLKGLGLRKDGDTIDYRERSPLVLPPGRDLQPPEPEGQAKKTAAWPNDPDIRRAKQRKEQDKKFVREDEEGARPELPSQYGRPNSPTRKDGGLPSKSAEESEAPSTSKELGTKSIFSNWWAPKEQYETFSGEPRRGSLTEPPSGYRTPSPHQPYGVGKEKWKPPATADRAVDQR